jgi:hypothetical protein
MSTTKEQLLSLLKSSITTLKNKNEELITDPQLRAAWQKESQLINHGVTLLPPEDIKWLNDEYGKWARANLTDPLNEFMAKGLQKNDEPENPEDSA